MVIIINTQQYPGQAFLGYTRCLHFSVFPTVRWDCIIEFWPMECEFHFQAKAVKNNEFSV